MKRLKALVCDALARPAYWCAAQSPLTVDVEMISRGQHVRPNGLREVLQAAIDRAEGQGYDAVALVYGLCGKATAGLTARSIPLVLPRAHDCITLFLGSREKYQQQFEQTPGTYWYAQDYLEREDGTGSGLSLGSGLEGDFTDKYNEYVAKYGKDNADYLMETMGAWQQHYQRAVFLDVALGNNEHAEAQAQADALKRGWAYERIAADHVLVRQLLFGEWNIEDYLVLQPGETVQVSFDAGIVCGEKTI